MATNFLDIIGKIDDLQAVLHEYEEELSQAERKNDTTNIKRLERLIEETENKIGKSPAKLKIFSRITSLA